MPKQDAGARIVAALRETSAWLDGQSPRDYDQHDKVVLARIQCILPALPALAEVLTAACAMRAFALVKPRLGSIAWNEQANKVDVAFDTALAALAAALGTEGEK